MQQPLPSPSAALEDRQERVDALVAAIQERIATSLRVNDQEPVEVVSALMTVLRRHVMHMIRQSTEPPSAWGDVADQVIRALAEMMERDVEQEKRK